MPEPSMHTCSHCAPAKASSRLAPAGWLSTVVLAILPKCPLCFVAFSSTAIICGNGQAAQVTHTTTSPITGAVSALAVLLVCLSLACNYQGRKTRRAFAVVLPASLMLLCSVWFGGGTLVYYSAAVLLALGVWLNAGLPSLWRRMQASSRSSQPSFSSNSIIQ